MNKHIGSNFDDFLQEENLFDEAEAVAIKRVLVFQIQEELEKKHLTKTAMAKNLHTSRAAIERLLDPANTGITLKTMVRAAHMLGKKVELTMTSA